MWYAIQVVVGQEDVMKGPVGKALAGVAGCELFVPKYLCMWKKPEGWTTMLRALFPGYLFLDFDGEQDEELKDEVLARLRIFSGKRVRPVCIGGGFYPIRPEEQEFLEGMMDGGHLIGVSVGNSVDGQPFIESGPLRGKEDRIVRIERHKRAARVRCSLWGESRIMKLGLELCWKDSEAPNEHLKGTVA